MGERGRERERERERERREKRERRERRGALINFARPLQFKEYLPHFQRLWLFLAEEVALEVDEEGV